MILEIVVGSFFLLAGMVSVRRSLAEPSPAEPGFPRLLAVAHDAAKAGVWLSLAAVFFGFGLLEEPQAIRWFALAPIVMAALRLATAYLLSRG